MSQRLISINGGKCLRILGVMKRVPLRACNHGSNGVWGLWHDDIDSVLCDLFNRIHYFTPKQMCKTLEIIAVEYRALE